MTTPAVDVRPAPGPCTRPNEPLDGNRRTRERPALSEIQWTARRLVRRNQGVAAIGLCLSILASCSDESLALDDGRTQLTKQLEASERQIDAVLQHQALETAGPRLEHSPGTYDYSLKPGRLSLAFHLTAVGDSRTGFGSTTVRVGACFRVIANATARTIRQEQCPKYVREAPQTGHHVEAEILKHPRELNPQ